ncbi:MAG TPA: O-antigen ligase family protein [Actinomycetota bacterium]|nr:O-antigen ligase family protein [Actinomycetota bacterium]
MRTLIIEKGPQIRRTALLWLAGGIPVVFLRSGIDPFNVPKLALLIAGVAVVASLRGIEVAQGARRPDWRALIVPAGAVAIPLVVAWLFSPYKGWALFGLFGRFQGLLPYLLVVVLGVLIADAFSGRAREVGWAMLVGASLVALYALIQIVGADPFSWDAFGAPAAAISTLGNSNFTGGLLAIAIPVAVALSVLEHPRRNLARKLALVVVVGCLATRSQGGYAGAFAGVAVTGGVLLSRRWVWAPRAGLGLAAVAVAGVIGVGFVAAARPELPLVPASAGLRGEWWVSAGSMGLDSPIAGRGPNTYALEGVKHRTIDDARELNFNFTDDPHSVPLALFAACGVLGLAGFVVVGAWAARIGMTAGSADVMRAGFFGAVTAYFVQSLVSIDELSLRVFLWVSLAGLVASLGEASPASKGRARKLADAKRKPGARQDALRGLPVVGVAVVVATAGVIYGASFVVVDARVQRAEAAYVSGDAAAGSSGYEAALAMRDDAYYRRLWARAEADIALAETSGDESFDKVLAAFSYLNGFADPRGLVDRARFLKSWAAASDPGVYDAARSAYEESLAMDDSNPLLRAEYAEVLIALEEFDLALEVLAPAMELSGSDRYAQVWGAAALARAELGDREGAAEAIAIALALNVDEVNAGKAQRLLDETSD